MISKIRQKFKTKNSTCKKLITVNMKARVRFLLRKYAKMTSIPVRFTYLPNYMFCLKLAKN